jgi:signal transduction histidine kinase
MASFTQAAPPTVRRTTAYWRSLGLSQQFLIASAAATIAAMSILGAWLSQRIEGAVSQYAALDAALYVEAVIGERVQGISEPISDPETQRQLESMVLRTPLGRRVVSFKVWAPGGRVLYASTPTHVGKTYPPTPHLLEAWAGKVVFQFDDLNDSEDELERSLKIPLLEIYVPVRKRFGGEIVSVVEFYEDATALVEDIQRAKRDAWLLLAALGSLVVAALYGMARGASRTIDRQNAALTDRISDLSRLLAQNSELQQRIEAASHRAGVLNERHLRRIGSDLHDGPAQLITLALFRLDAMEPRDPVEPVAGEQALKKAAMDRGNIRQALVQALKEIRQLSVGLSVPEVDNMGLSETITAAVRAHEHRTAARVNLDLAALPGCSLREIKVALYRFLQEGLSNAWQHANGATVEVKAYCPSRGMLGVEIVDDGPGFELGQTGSSDRLGIVGMRERIEGVGGMLEIASGPGKGTRLLARIPVVQGVRHAE